MDLVVETADRIYYQSDHLELSSSVARTEHYPVHRHPLQFQLEVVLRGETECGIGRQRFSVPEHCFSVINPDVDHYNVHGAGSTRRLSFFRTRLWTTPPGRCTVCYRVRWRFRTWWRHARPI